MKRIGAVIALLLCVSAVLSQGIAGLNKYEEQKKDKATALVYSLVLPGAGLFYAERHWSGIASLVGTVAILSQCDKTRTSDPTTYAAILLALRLVDIGFAFGAVDDYNTDIRLRLKFSLSPQPHGASVTVTVSI